MIKIYSSPTCTNCIQLKNFCNNEGIKFEELNINSDFKARSKMIARGLSSLPTIEYNNRFYNGDLEYLKQKAVELND